MVESVGVKGSPVGRRVGVWLLPLVFPEDIPLTLQSQFEKGFLSSMMTPEVAPHGTIDARTSMTIWFCAVGGFLKLFTSDTTDWVFASMVTNVVLSVGSYVFLYDKFANDLPLSIAVAAIVVATNFLGSMLPFIVRVIGRRRLLVSLVSQVFSIIVAFASIYRGFGLAHSGDAIGATSWDIALYFSMVTWTTLGYGDYHPVRGIELLAGSEALLGYVYLGVMVSLFAVHLDGRNPTGR